MNADNAKKWRILCIDDEPDILEILRFALGMKHEVITASNGLEAIGMLDYCDADFIVCDVRMPQMDGFQTVEAIRRHREYFNVPVFFLTAETGADMAKRGFASGANLYLTKPFDPARVLKNIEYFLNENGCQPKNHRHSQEKINALIKESHNPEPEAAPSVADMPTSVFTPAMQDTKPVSLSQVRVIVISQDANQLSRFEEALSKNYECVACADPLSSLQKLFSYDPDVLVINPAIPKLSGMGLVQMIKMNGQLRNLPIIMVQDLDKPFDQRMLPTITDQPALPPTATGGDVVHAVRRVVDKPGFRVRGKKFTMAVLKAEEERLRSEMDTEMRRLARSEAVLRDRYRKIQGFIDQNML